MLVRNKIKPEKAEQECGFSDVKSTDTTNKAVYILLNIIGRALEIQKEVYLYFVDYTTIVRHEEITSQLAGLKKKKKAKRFTSDQKHVEGTNTTMRV